MDESKDKKIGVKIVCVFLSFALWLYISNFENPSRTLNLNNVPVELVNEDSLKTLNLALSPDQEFYIDLKLEGPASQIYTVTKVDFKISIDLGAYALKSGDNNIPVQVINYPEGINIKSEAVLSIKVKVEDLVEKEVKLKSNVNKTFKMGFSEKSSTIEPSVIKVSGPKTLIDKVNTAVIIGDAIDIAENYEDTFSIQAVDKDNNEISGVVLSKDKAVLKLNVVRGKQVNIKTKYIGALPDGLSIEKEELSNSVISISGSSDIVSNIEYLDIEPINLNIISSSGEVKANIVVPAGVTISSDESYITVTLTLKDDRITTKTIESVPITYTDMNEDKFIYEVVSSVNITLSGTTSDLASITKENIKIESSLKNIDTVGTYDEVWNASLSNATNVKVDTSTGSIKVMVKEMQK